MCLLRRFRGSIGGIWVFGFRVWGLRFSVPVFRVMLAGFSSSGPMARV